MFLQTVYGVLGVIMVLVLSYKEKYLGSSVSTAWLETRTLGSKIHLLLGLGPWHQRVVALDLR